LERFPGCISGLGTENFLIISLSFFPSAAITLLIKIMYRSSYFVFMLPSIVSSKAIEWCTSCTSYASLVSSEWWKLNSGRSNNRDLRTFESYRYIKSWNNGKTNLKGALHLPKRCKDTGSKRQHNSVPTPRNTLSSTSVSSAFEQDTDSANRPQKRNPKNCHNFPTASKRLQEFLQCIGLDWILQGVDSKFLSADDKATMYPHLKDSRFPNHNQIPKRKRQWTKNRISCQQ
jgi:hypothetical protein